MQSVPEPIKPHRRRSGRLPVRLVVILRWRDLDGNFHEELAETVRLSKYGGLLECPARFKAGEEIFLWWPERQREARIRVVFRRIGGTQNLSEVGFEFMDVEDFWGIEFPPEVAPWERLRRRRSTRIPKRVELLLRWTDENGDSHEEPAETRLWSRYGGSLVSRASIQAGVEISIWWPERQKGIQARIVSRRANPENEAAGLTEMAFEFVTSENFWEEEFLRDIAPWDEQTQ